MPTAASTARLALDRLEAEGARRLRVVVLDDDPVFRSFLSKTLTQLGLEVVGLCPSIESAKRRLSMGDVDAVSVDVVLREESGLDFLTWCHASHRSVITVLVTAGSAKEARTGVDAVFLGAAALLTKPDARSLGGFESELRRVFADGRLPAKPPAARPSLLKRQALVPGLRTELLALGASTGGPPALLSVLSGLPAAFDVPIAITQHMPARHIEYLADALRQRSGRNVVVASDGAPLTRGMVVLAGHGRHLQVERVKDQLFTRLVDGPAEHSSKPSVDSLFRSIARSCRGTALGVVLTGMGEDGAAGAMELRAANNPVLVQSPESSVVWGMPGAVMAHGGADAMLSADAMAGGIVEWMGFAQIGAVE